jgi:Zn-dependent protease
MNPTKIVELLAFLPALVMAITLHEYAHARTALAFGDTTARDAGRVTLNPLSHMDPIGTLAIMFVGFGWGRPVPVNVSNLRHPRADLLVSGAGPATNLVVAALMGIPLHYAGWFEWLNQWQLGTGAAILCLASVQLNLMLGLFNLLPIGSLDGASVLPHLLPARLAEGFVRFNRQYGGMVLLGLILGGYLLPVSPIAAIIGPPMRALQQLILGSA